MEDTNTEGFTIEGLRESLGIQNATETQDPKPENADQNEPAPAAASETTESGMTNPETTDEKTPAPSADNKPEQKPQELPLEKLNKEAHAFAEMRSTIAAQNKVLADIGAALGITGKPNEILEGLKKITNAQQAKNAGVPPEIMERLTALEQEKQERAAQDRKIQVYAAISNFQRNQGLDEKQLNAFLVQLAQAGKNPFERDVDLRAEYLVMNFDMLQKQAVQKALEEQARLDQKAATQGTNPGTKTGGGANHPTEVKTLDDLDRFLKENVK